MTVILNPGPIVFLMKADCRTIYNRDEDVAWLQEKVTWLFREAGVEMLPFENENAGLWVS